ncbi:MAG: hypothetical protein MUF05_02205 [Candidatus Omnitrophica bacterium]|jgi:putative protease|nr:hypothetical protein [Candidatus Omnitrophota bacterium]
MPLKKKKKTTRLKKKPAKKIAQKKPAKKAIKKKSAAKKKIVKKKQEGTIVGIVTHYFPKVSAAVIKVKLPLSTGDSVRFKGHTTDFTQNINSMQMDHAPISTAKKNQEIGLEVISRVRQHDLVYKNK